MQMLVIATVLAVVITVENAISTSWVLMPLFWGFHVLPGIWGPVVSIASVMLVVGVLTLLLRWIMVVALGVLVVYCFPAVHFGKVDYALGDLARDHLAQNPRDIQEVTHIFGLLHWGLVALAVVAGVAFLMMALRRVF